MLLKNQGTYAVNDVSILVDDGVNKKTTNNYNLNNTNNNLNISNNSNINNKNKTKDGTNFCLRKNWMSLDFFISQSP